MIKLKKSLIFGLAVCMALAATACQDKGTDAVEEGVKAKVNDKVITQEEYDKQLSFYKKVAETQYGEGAWDMKVAEGQTIGNYYESTLLDQLISDLVLVDAAEKEGIKVTDEELDGELQEFKSYMETDDKYKQFLESYGMNEDYLKESLRKEYVINHYLSSKIENLEPTDEELQTLFNSLKMNESVRASHILVKTEDEAKNVIDRLNKGESFEDLATELSIDTASKDKGGDLDYFSYSEMVQPFSDAAFSMEAGQISEPVKSEFGYHIIKVTDKKVDDTVTLETKKDELTKYYKSLKYQELLNKLISEANITKDE